MSYSSEDILSNTARPSTDATLTIRIIKSLRFRTEKSLVLHHIDLTTTTVALLRDTANKGTTPTLSPDLALTASSHRIPARMEALPLLQVWSVPPLSLLPHHSYPARHPQALYQGPRGQGQSKSIQI